MVDARDLKSLGFGRAGSSPASGTRFRHHRSKRLRERTRFCRPIASAGSGGCERLDSAKMNGLRCSLEGPAMAEILAPILITNSADPTLSMP